jgi:cyclopropane fatty-acyl-phospholipid synthase-like methyltransferase
MPAFEIADIRRYYDRHTRSFVRFGQGGRDGAIHRAVWGPGVTTRSAAFHYVDDRIEELTLSLPPSSGTSHLVDLGCGIGASLCYLAARLPVRATGITLSAVQARLANERIHEARLSDRVTCIQGDYCDIPSSVQRADVAYAIESFVHATAPHLLFAACARLIRPQGLLVICDDFRRAATNQAAARAIGRFKRGWHINTLLSGEELLNIARAAGFEHEWTLDLSHALEVRRTRDRAINVIAAVADWIPFAAERLDYLLGGAALQECLINGWIGYDLAVFRKRESDPQR